MQFDDPSWYTCNQLKAQEIQCCLGRNVDSNHSATDVMNHHVTYVHMRSSLKSKSVINLKQNEAQGVRAESTHKGVN